MDMFPLHFDTDTELHEAMMKFKHDLYETDSVLCQIFATCKPLCTILPRCTNMLLTCHNQSCLTNTKHLWTEKNEQCHVLIQHLTIRTAFVRTRINGDWTDIASHQQSAEPLDYQVLYVISRICNTAWVEGCFSM